MTKLFNTWASAGTHTGLWEDTYEYNHHSVVCGSWKLKAILASTSSGMTEKRLKTTSHENTSKHLEVLS